MPGRRRDRARRRGLAERHDGLACLAKAHVVGEDRAPAAEQERDAFDLVREQALGQPARSRERGVDSGLWRLAEKLGEE